jgi:threonine aldolase
VYQPRTSLVSIEQTHNFGGGAVWSIDEYEAVCAAARAGGAAVFTDGARLLNAVAATGVPADRWATPVDAVWIDFSKGIGAPGGAAIAASAEFIGEVRRFKFLYGGGMRQSGVLAAGALHGLEHNVPRLAEDHVNARRLAQGLAEAGIAVETPESNMVFCQPPDRLGLDGFVQALAAEGVRAAAVAGRVRMVTHVDISTDDIEVAITAAARVVGAV